ncbi:MAG: hypothetical protein ACE5GJ_10440 [Gemmatimonadota bacterium]
MGIGHPCFGCTEAGIAFSVPLHENLPITDVTPPATYPPVNPEHGRVSPAAASDAGPA